MTNNISIITKDMVDSWTEQMINPIDRFLIRAYFEGMGNKNAYDILGLTKEDLDNIKDNLLQVKYPCKGKNICHTIKVSDALIEEAYEAAATYKYVYDKYGHEKQLYDIDNNEDNETSSYVYKAEFEEPCDWHYTHALEGIHKLLRNISTRIGTEIHGSDLRTGGKIHYVNERCKTLGITAKEFMDNQAYKHELCWQFSMCEDKFDGDMFLNAYRSHLI